MKHTLIITLLSLLSIGNAFAQIDTEFWFAAPDLSRNHSPRPIQLRIMSFSQAATVTVTQPANLSVAPIVRNLPANSYTIIEYALDSNNDIPQVETSQVSGNDIKNTGILISSTAEISAYYINRGDNSEAYALKGKNALGRDFLVPGQTEYTSRHVGDARNTVEIVASEDGTVVTIKPSRPCIGHPAGTQFNIILNKGQAYALKGVAVGDLLYNTTVKSNKPVAVNYTDDSVNCPGGDLIGDQLVPVDLLGTEYVVIRNEKGNADKVYILPTENGTIVTINGVAQATMNVGGSRIYSLGIASTSNIPIATYITSNKPISVLLLAYKGAEPGASILPALSCTGSSQISYYPAESSAIVNIVTKTENVDYFSVLGNPYAIPNNLFLPVPNTGGEYSYFRGEVSGNPVIRIVNSKGLFQAGFFESGGNTCSYGYFSNYNVFPLSASFDKTFYFEGDNIVLQLPDSAQFNNVVWTGPNGFSDSGAQIVISPASIQHSGMWIVNASHIDGCTVVPDTFYITVFEKHNKQEIEICYGNTVTLSAQGSAPYLWNGGQTTQNISVQPARDITYTVSNMYEGEQAQMFQIQDSFFVAVRDSLKPVVSGDLVICNGQASITAEQGYETYLWNTGATTRSINVSNSGSYWVKVTSGDCRGTGFYSVAPTPDIKISFNQKPETCIGEPFLEIPLTTIEGEAGSFSLLVQEPEFTDILNQQISGNTLQIPLENLNAGLYHAELKIFEKNCGKAVSYPLEIMVKYPANIITQRWNDVLAIKNSTYNGGYNFTAFKWYLNGTPIPDATKSFLYQEAGFKQNQSDRYSALLTNERGDNVFTCDFVPEYLPNATIQVSLVSTNQVIPTTEQGTVYIYNITGAVVSIQQVENNQFNAPDKPGIYIIQVNNERRKILVR
ncbi:MAG: T9SS type A sorting domain-containing protein [Paludibacter sp.]|jgi:hypothetical protein|nr:T9SS type A sorting domain-containing protein [Paludibacter sp.]